eukprot:gb/GECH01000607.1/.p1 GENE.gb/GECH01000607.1/~~gb/GECH01000607.1/.p1  ORF type:complete len:637 (+),score=136.25 gb/GECH01000607.1/:1-1911(+)
MSIEPTKENPLLYSDTIDGQATTFFNGEIETNDESVKLSIEEEKEDNNNNNNSTTRNTSFSFIFNNKLLLLLSVFILISWLTDFRLWSSSDDDPSPSQRTKHVTIAPQLLPGGNPIALETKRDPETTEETSDEEISGDDASTLINQMADDRTRSENLVWRLVFNSYEYSRIVLRTVRMTLQVLPAILLLPICYLSPQLWPVFYRVAALTLRYGGPCFIKLGQWAATRPDLFDPDFCTELSKLHSKAPVHSMWYTRKIIEEEYSNSLENIFSRFDETPIASGAIAQIHRAKLRGDPREVVVKVRHPKVDTYISRDLRILLNICKLVDSTGIIKWASFEDNVITFTKNMRAQIDLTFEKENMKRFNEHFIAIENINFPQPIDMSPYYGSLRPRYQKATPHDILLHGKHLLRSPRVLVETFESGIPISRVLNDQDNEFSKHTKKTIGLLGITLYLKMMLVDNFVHADLHPGNLIVRLRKDEVPQLTVLDTGLVCSLSKQDRQNFIDLFSAVASGNGSLAAQLMVDRARPELVSKLTKDMVEGFKRDMQDVVDDVARKPIGEVEVSNVLQRVLNLGRIYHVPVESNFTTLVLGTVVIEGLGRQLFPDLNLVDEARPFLLASPTALEAYMEMRFKGRHVKF